MKSLLSIVTLFIVFIAFETNKLQTSEDKQIQLYIVIPSYNNEKWVVKNLASVTMQSYPFWKAIYINDASTDKTGIFAEKFIKESKFKNKFTVIHNKERIGSLANIYNAVSKADPSNVILLLDGDDWFVNQDVFAIISAIYKNDPNLWLTYGNLIEEPAPIKNHACWELPPEVIKNRSYRSYTYVYSHLRTFYAGLFQCIKKEDFLYTDGNFLPSAGDVSYMFPMLEMASEGHFRYLPYVFYVYNMDNPLNDFRNLELQNRCADLIRSRPSYKPLKKAPWRK